MPIEGQEISYLIFDIAVWWMIEHLTHTDSEKKAMEKILGHQQYILYFSAILLSWKRFFFGQM